MLEIKVDLLKNRLYINLGRVRKDTLASAINTVAKEVEKLESGFTCITRVIDVRAIDDNDLKTIREIQKFLSKKGMRKAVRVGTEDGKKLLEEVGKNAGYSADTASTMQEAEKKLDAWLAANKEP